jgi:xanthine dehydrogenase iron-sulfur cluster and FAD-binding subunit A
VGIDASVFVTRLVTHNSPVPFQNTVPVVKLQKAMPPTCTLNINGQQRAVDCDPDTPLLWVLRDSLDLVGTKFGCGGGFCGACTVHVDGQPRRACNTPLSAVAARRITTIEGLSGDGTHPVQRAGRRSTCRSAAIARLARS